MEKTKLKNGLPERNKFLFLFLWLAGHILGWAVFIPLAEILDDNFGLTGILLGIAVVVGGITSLVQYTLIRRQFGRNLKKWVPLSLIAWLIATSYIFPFTENFGETQIDVMTQALALFVPATLVQTILLRRHVHNAWLWLLASVTGTATFALPIATSYGEEWTILAGYGFYASATALTLLWLFGMAKRPEKQKMAESAHERLMDTNKSEHRIEAEIRSNVLEERK